MKNYFLIGFESTADARLALSDAFPDRGGDTWVMFAKPEDPMAWFDIGTNEYSEWEDFPNDANLIRVDVSGRHYNEDDKIIAALSELQDRIGGYVFNDRSVRVR